MATYAQKITRALALVDQVNAALVRGPNNVNQHSELVSQVVELKRVLLLTDEDRFIGQDNSVDIDAISSAAVYDHINNPTVFQGFQVLRELPDEIDDAFHNLPVDEVPNASVEIHRWGLSVSINGICVWDSNTSDGIELSVGACKKSFASQIRQATPPEAWEDEDQTDKDTSK